MELDLPTPVSHPPCLGWPHALHGVPREQKLGEGGKVSLSYFALMSFALMSLRANVNLPKVAVTCIVIVLSYNL